MTGGLPRVLASLELYGVDPAGFEPATSCMPCKHSCQLSYGPIFSLFYHSSASGYRLISSFGIDGLYSRIPSDNNLKISVSLF
jgi:hypothetical protein